MDTRYEALEKIFHTPARLAIVSELAAGEGLTFNSLKENCGLTDGNLSRHLSALEKAGIVRIEKAFVEQKPRTTVVLTGNGRRHFLEYLDALEQVLREAEARARPAKKEKKESAPQGAAKLTRF